VTSAALQIDTAHDAELESDEALVVSVTSFEGPLHLLLAMARSRKVDLTQISVSDLADQFLVFVSEAKGARIDLASEYLVMASWLTLLKSRLLNPPRSVGQREDETDPEGDAGALAARLVRLEALRTAAKSLDRLPRLGRDVFKRGCTEELGQGPNGTKRIASLVELLSAYGKIAGRERARSDYMPTVRRAWPLETARSNLGEKVETLDNWARLESLLPCEASSASPQDAFSPPPRSYLASLFGAALELARDRRIEIENRSGFSPEVIRSQCGATW
jgi:segregation and condensation protein A